MEGSSVVSVGVMGDIIMRRRAAATVFSGLAALASLACAPGLLVFPATPAAAGSGGTPVVKEETAPVPADTTLVRFAVVGDPGLPEQTAVGRSVARVCGFDGEPRCDFTLLLGDNLYPSGVRKQREAEDRARLESIVAPLSARPVYLTLGNHDWHSQRPRIARAQRELRWVAETEGVYGNAHFYELEAGPLRLRALDTNYLVRRKRASQDAALREWVAGIERSEAIWTVAFGHHPYRSNGHHGNAGRFRDGGLRLWPGKRFAAFMEAQVLPRVDLYLAGHEHSLQFFVEPLGERQVATAVVGSAAKCGGRARRPANPERTGVAAAFELYGFGFAVVEGSRERLAVSFYDQRGDEVWSAEKERGSRDWSYEAREPTVRCP